MTDEARSVLDKNERIVGEINSLVESLREFEDFVETLDDLSTYESVIDNTQANVALAGQRLSAFRLRLVETMERRSHGTVGEAYSALKSRLENPYSLRITSEYHGLLR